MKAYFDNSKQAWREDLLVDGVRYSGTDMVGKMLRDTGYTGVVEFYRNGVLVGTLDAGKTDKHGRVRADYALSESDTKRLGLVKYVPYTDIQMA